MNNFDYDANGNLTRYMSRGWQNPALPAFTNPDPLAENYLPISPYAYCGGDPINRIDPTGMKIDMLAMTWTDQALGSDYVTRIISDLCDLTGLSLYINDNNQLDYAKDKNGDPIIDTIDINGVQLDAGSKTARNLLIKKISAEESIEPSITNKGSSRDDKKIALNPSQINELITNAVGIDDRTLGYGMVFLHELLHTDGLKDSTNDIGTGAVVDYMNQIRMELNNNGYNFGQRMNYKAFPINSIGYQIIPFDQSSFFNAMNGHLPATGTKYIKTKIPK